METDRSKWGLFLNNTSTEQLVDKIHIYEEDLVRVETFLEICWEELRRRRET